MQGLLRYIYDVWELIPMGQHDDIGEVEEDVFAFNIGWVVLAFLLYIAIFIVLMACVC